MNSLYFSVSLQNLCNLLKRHNLDLNRNYHKHCILNKNKKVHKISDIWNWTVNILIPNLHTTHWNNSQIINQSFLINDLSSVIFGNAIIKQKRVSEGIYLD